jgi:TetR/AcrR family transcriptional regulator, mexCD-oprJ operon repressor
MTEAGARLRTPAAILEAAARVLAARGDATMNEIAAVAGVGRATLYRHFPTREALLEALEAEARQELAARVADAALGSVPVPEALQRLLRAIFTVGDRYVFLARQYAAVFSQQPDEHAEHQVGTPIRAVLQRGIDDQTLRGDLTADQLVPLLGGLALAAFAAELPQTTGVEQAAAIITSLFLCGARSQP